MALGEVAARLPCLSSPELLLLLLLKELLPLGLNRLRLRQERVDRKLRIHAQLALYLVNVHS